MSAGHHRYHRTVDKGKEEGMLVIAYKLRLKVYLRIYRKEKLLIVVYAGKVNHRVAVEVAKCEGLQRWTHNGTSTLWGQSAKLQGRQVSFADELMSSQHENTLCLHRCSVMYFSLLSSVHTNRGGSKSLLFCYYFAPLLVGLHTMNFMVPRMLLRARARTIL